MVADHDLQIGERRPRGGVCGDGTDGVPPGGFAKDQQEGANGALRRNGTARHDAESGVFGEGGGGDQSQVGRAGRQALGTLRGHHAFDLVAIPKHRGLWRMVEVPHQRRGVQKADGSDA